MRAHARAMLAPMTSLRERIDADLKKAMLAKDEVAKDTLRLAKSELLLREVDLGEPISDEEATAVLKKSVKSRKDAIAQFREGGREDAALEEEAQLAVLAKYLPEELSEDATRAAIATITKELGLTTKRDMGTLMKELKARHPSVDGKLASKLAGEVLS